MSRLKRTILVVDDEIEILRVLQRSLGAHGYEVFLANSGAEAVEGAIKLARYATGRPAIINFQGSFHGRTMMSVALTTSKLLFRERLEPLPGPIYTAPYPYVYRSSFRDSPSDCVKDCLHKLRLLFHQLILKQHYV